MATVSKFVQGSDSDLALEYPKDSQGRNPTIDHIFEDIEDSEPCQIPNAPRWALEKVFQMDRRLVAENYKYEEGKRMPDAIYQLVKDLVEDMSEEMQKDGRMHQFLILADFLGNREVMQAAAIVVANKFKSFNGDQAKARAFFGIPEASAEEWAEAKRVTEEPYATEE